MTRQPVVRAPFPFIVGCGRSGTTLLATMLDSHPDVAIPGESGFLLEVCRHRRVGPLARGGAGRPPGPVTAEFVRRIGSHPRFRAWGMTEESLTSWLNAHEPRDFADAMRLTYLAYAGELGKTRFGDKTPDHVLVMDRLAELFPEAVFIHLIRDGRDVALSLLDMPWGPVTIEDAAAYWQWRVATGRRIGSRLGHERYLEVRYDDLVNDPETTAREVAKVAGLPYEPEMLDRTGAAERQLRMSPDPETDRGILSKPRTGLRTWKQQMAAEDAALFTSVAGPTLASCGFEAGPDLACMTTTVRRRLQRRTVGARIRVARSATRWRLGQTARYGVRP